MFVYEKLAPNNFKIDHSSYGGGGGRPIVSSFWELTIQGWRRISTPLDSISTRFDAILGIETAGGDQINSSFVASPCRGLVSTGSRGAAAPPDFENPKKLSHKNAIKLDFSEKWGKIGLLAPPDFWSSRGPCSIPLWSWSCVFRNLYKCYQKGMNLAFINLAITYSFWGKIAQNVCLTLIQILEPMITTYPKIFWVYLHFHILMIKLENLQQKFYFFFIIIGFYNHPKYSKWHYNCKTKLSISSKRQEVWNAI